MRTKAATSDPASGVASPNGEISGADAPRPASANPWAKRRAVSPEHLPFKVLACDTSQRSGEPQNLRQHSFCDVGVASELTSTRARRRSSSTRHQIGFPAPIRTWRPKTTRLGCRSGGRLHIRSSSCRRSDWRPRQQGLRGGADRVPWNRRVSLGDCGGQSSAGLARLVRLLEAVAPGIVIDLITGSFDIRSPAASARSASPVGSPIRERPHCGFGTTETQRTSQP